MPGWQFAKRKFIKLRNLKLCVLLLFFSTVHKSEAEVSEAQVFESTLSKAKMHEADISEAQMHEHEILKLKGFKACLL